MKRSFSTEILNYNSKLSIPFLSPFQLLTKLRTFFTGWLLTSSKQLANLTSIRTDLLLPSITDYLAILQIFIFFKWSNLLFEGMLEVFFLIRILIFHYCFLLKTHGLGMEVAMVSGGKCTLRFLGQLHVPHHHQGEENAISA